MNGEILFSYVKRQAEKVSIIANLSNMGWGYAIPIPEDADEEARVYVNGELAKLCWNFHMTNIGRQWYVVLFPL